MTISLSEQDVDRIVALYRAGLSVLEVSERTGPSTTWIRQVLRQRGVIRTRAEAAALFWQRREMATTVLAAWNRNEISVARVIRLLEPSS